jgi:PAS domain S-box-containing protein
VSPKPTGSAQGSSGAAVSAGVRAPVPGDATEPPGDDGALPAALESAGTPAPIDLATVLAGVSAGITVQDQSGNLLYANEVAARMSGYDTPEEMIQADPRQRVDRFELLNEAGEPFDPRSLPGRRVLLGEAPEPILIGFRLSGGTERWSLLQSVPAVLPDGRPVAVSTFHDVTPRVEAERQIRERERRFRELSAERRKAEDRLESVLRHMPVGVILVDAADRRLLFANDAARRLPHIRFRIGDPLQYLGNRGFREDGSPLAGDQWPLLRAIRGETIRNEVLVIEDADGGRRTYSISASPMRDRSGGVDLIIETVTDITERVAAEQRERFLERAGEVLASSLDYEQTVQRVADLAVPAFADWCVVQLADEEGLPHRIAVAHRDPTLLAMALQASHDYPPDPESPTGAAAILRDGHTEYVPDITADQVDAAAQDDRHRDLLRSLSLRSAIAVPLLFGGRITGVLTLINGESGRRFEPDEVAFAESLAARAAAAIENARLFREGVRFKRLLDATSDAVLLVDPEEGRLLYANRGAVEQFGRPIDELLTSALPDHLSPEDGARIREAMASLDSSTGDARSETVRLHRADRRTIPVDIRLQLVTLAAEPPRILAVARDLTERVAAEESLRRVAGAEHARAAELNAVIRAMGEGVFVCDRDGTIILANPAAEDTFPDVQERTYAEVLAELEDPDRAAPSLGVVGGPVELRARHGEERWIEVSTWPVAADLEAGARDETIVVLRDVTEARQRQAVRDTFIGVLSHELRTPVTTIYAGAKVLSRPSELSAETRSEIFHDIVVESERLHRLVEDVVAMTRFGEEGGDVGAEPVLLQRLLPTVVTSEQLRWPGVRFELDLPGGLPTVIADPTYVEQVVRNLLSNAAKYGGAENLVDIVVEGAEGEVMVRILDDGPGFPPDETDKLFELFFRSARTSRAASGAGIGLFVCARLIRAMGGRIWAVNRPAGGAEFGFALRVMDED